VFSALL